MPIFSGWEDFEVHDIHGGSAGIADSNETHGVWALVGFGTNTDYDYVSNYLPL